MSENRKKIIFVLLLNTVLFLFLLSGLERAFFWRAFFGEQAESFLFLYNRSSLCAIFFVYMLVFTFRYPAMAFLHLVFLSLTLNNISASINGFYIPAPLILFFGFSIAIALSALFKRMQLAAHPFKKRGPWFMLLCIALACLQGLHTLGCLEYLFSGTVTEFPYSRHTRITEDTYTSLNAFFRVFRVSLVWSLIVFFPWLWKSCPFLAKIKVRSILKAICLAGALQILVAIIQILFMPELFKFKGFNNALPATGLSSNSPAFALVLSLTLWAFYFYLGKLNIRKSIFLITAGALVLWAVNVSTSRSALIFLTCSFILYQVFRRPERFLFGAKKKALLFGTIFLFFCLTLFTIIQYGKHLKNKGWVPPSRNNVQAPVMARFSEMCYFISRGDFESLSPERAKIWNYALDFGRERPLLGQGFGAFPLLMSNASKGDYEDDTANLYLHFWVSGGILFLLVGLGWLIGIFLKNYKRLLREPPGFEKKFSAFICSALLSLLIIGLVGVHFSAPEFLFIFLLLALLAEREKCENQIKID